MYSTMHDRLFYVGFLLLMKKQKTKTKQEIQPKSTNSKIEKWDKI